jgi:heterodisulfide reductase subunit A-like polyferredoxin
VRHGAVVVATGAREERPEGRFLYGEHPSVVTQLELGERLARGQLASGVTIVMIQCVGSREPERPVCSRVCCQAAVRNALEIVQEAPGARVIVLHRDIRTVGGDERLYEQAREAGVVFIRIDEEHAPRLEPRSESVVSVHFDDPLIDRPVRVDAELVVLSAAAVPELASGETASTLDIRLAEGGFAKEANPKFRPVESSRRGVLIAGFAAGPVLLSEAMAQARAAAARAVAVLSREVVQPRPGAAAFRAKWCASCGLCVEVCLVGAREIEEGEGARVHAGLCQGCGACAVACPSGTTDLPGLDDRSILTMIEEVLP